MKKAILISVFSIIVIISLAIFCIYYVALFPNISAPDKNDAYIYIYEGDTFDNLLTQLQEKDALININTFVWLSRMMDFPTNMKVGRYQLKNGVSNLTFLRGLKSGNQAPIKITFNNIRTKEQLAGRLGSQLMIDSLEIIYMLNDYSFLETYELTPETVPAIFIPNTYEVYWNVSSIALFERMWNEYNRFWSENRRAKAEAIGFSPIQISILASIVEEETNYSKEKPTVAGVYINRLKKRMILQADPTVKFALGDFTIKRVLNEHKEIDSPYNTYMYAGLPPGPIRIPSISSIDAVLNYEKHNYLFMCAKDDFSGKHAFATTHKEHQQNAAKYHNALNKRKIYK